MKKRKIDQRAVNMGTPANQLKCKQKTEKKRAVFTILGAALAGGGFVLFVMLFGFQNGLHPTERCYCSWEKVGWFSAAGFLTIALQLVAYLIFYYIYKSVSNNQKRKRAFERNKLLKIISFVILADFTGCIIMALMLPLLIDQNQNLFWLIQNNWGCFSLVMVFILSAAVGTVSMCCWTQHMPKPNK